MKVRLISSNSTTDLTQGTDYNVSDRVVTLTNPTSLKIQIYRETTTKPLVGWADASVLRAADMTVQSTQLLHLSEETMDKVQDGGLAQDTNDGVWDARYNRIKNLLDPKDPGDAVTLSYIVANQTSLINALKATGKEQNESIVSTGNTQNTRLTTTGDTQNKRLTDTGDSYVSTMTTLKDTATTKATEASNSAELSKKWAMSSTSPDGVAGNKSSKTWAEEAKSSASASATSATSAKNSATSATNSATKAATSETNAKASATSATNSATKAATSATNAKTSETNAANSASSAKQSALQADKFNPTNYFRWRNIADYGNDVTKALDTGWYTIFKDTLHAPDTTDGVSVLFVYQIESGRVLQLVRSMTQNSSFMRVMYPKDTWTPWKKLTASTGAAMTALGDFDGRDIRDSYLRYTWENRYNSPLQLSDRRSFIAYNFVDDDKGIPHGLILQTTSSAGKQYTSNLLLPADGEQNLWIGGYKASTGTRAPWREIITKNQVQLLLRNIAKYCDIGYEDPSICTATPLLSKTCASGDITLKQPYTNFNGLVIYATTDNGTYWTRHYIATATLNKLKTLGNFYLFNGNIYWCCSPSSTTTVLKGVTDNCIIQQIYGIKLHEYN